MIQRVRSNVAQRFDSTRAAESELVPLTLVDDDSPRSLSSLDSPRVQLRSTASAGGGLQGKRLTYAGSASDTVLAWPAAADAKMSHGRAPSPNSEPLLDRIKRAANDKVSQVTTISGRTYAAAQAHLQERNARRERRHITVSDLRFDALSRLQEGQPAGAELQALWARSPTAGMDALPQLCAHLITHSSATMRWPEEDEDKDEDDEEPEGRNKDVSAFGGVICGGGDVDDTDGDLLPNLSPNKRAAEAAAIAAAAHLREPEPEPETEPEIDLSSPTWREEGSDGPLRLPEGWTEHWDDEHRCYFYYHEQSARSSWERPRLVEALPLPTDAVPELGDAHHHPSKYYYCAATGDAQWTKPGPGATLDGLPTAAADTCAGAAETTAWVTITMEESGGAQALRRFLLTKCKESFRTAMSAYWLLAAAADAEESCSSRSAEPSAPPADSGSPQEGRAKVAQRLAKVVLRASAAGRLKRMSEAAAAAPDTMFPEQAAFGLRREHAFCLQLVELAESLVEQNPGFRRGALARGLETFNQTMLPAALMAPTVHEDHLLLRAHTAPPAAPKAFATNTRCPYMVFFEAVELAPREAGIPLATLRNAGTMRRIHADSPVATVNADGIETSEPGSPSELRIGRLPATPNDTLDSALATRAGGRHTKDAGSDHLSNQREPSRIPPAGTHVEVYSVSDDRWHTGSIVARVLASEVAEAPSPENDGTSASSDGYIRVEYNHGSRQKVVLWGDETVVRLSTSAIRSGRSVEHADDTLKVMEPGRAKLLATSVSVGSSVDDDDDDDNDSQSDSDGVDNDVALVGARLAGWNGAMDTISTKERERQVRAASPYGKLAGWRLVSFIVKADDDLRQEQLAMQLIDEFAQEFQRQGLALKLTTYAIIPITATAGLLETVSGAVSIDSLKKRLLENNRLYNSGSARGAGSAAEAPTLTDHFEDRWGSEKRRIRKAARRRFIESLAAYSIVNYLLAVRDRHNGNILIDEQGRVVHIDFGFFLSNSPGGNANFERAPFKLTREMIDVMGGEHSLEFATFRDLVIRGFRASHRIYPKIRTLVQIALEAYGGQFPCFSGGTNAVLDGLDRRFRTDLTSKREAAQFVNEELINPSIDNWRTRWYDKYQMCCLGIL